MHILATEIASLDEAEAAVDLAQSPAEVVVLSFSDSDLSALAAAWQRDAARLPSLRLASLKKLRHPMSVDLYVDTVVAKAKVVIVRCLGGLDYWRYGLERIDDAAGKARAARSLLPRGRCQQSRQRVAPYQRLAVAAPCRRRAVHGPRQH